MRTAVRVLLRYLCPTQQPAPAADRPAAAAAAAAAAGCLPLSTVGAGEGGGATSLPCHSSVGKFQNRENGARTPSSTVVFVSLVRSLLSSISKARATASHHALYLVSSTDEDPPIAPPTAMATTTTNPFAAASSPLTPMHPTMTEHDFRFPRRPDPASSSSSNGPRKTDRFDQLYAQSSSSSLSSAAAAAFAASTAAAASAASATTSSASTKAAAVPRIPGGAAAAGPASMMMAAGPGALRAGLHGDFRLDQYPLTHASAHHHQNDLLRAAAFPPFQQGAARQAETVDEMQRQDPFALQIWKFYARTKQQLPAQERMENLSWRMMYPKLLRARAASAARYVASPLLYMPSKHALLDETSSQADAVGQRERTSRVAGASANAPSGIAQLRKSSEHAPPQPDPMNLDDFIHNDNVGTPAGLALTPTPETMRHPDDKSGLPASTTAIPIKSRQEPSSSQHSVPQSVPVAAHQRMQDEFGYLPRHPRKTSIDETGQRVSLLLLLLLLSLGGESGHLSPPPPALGTPPLPPRPHLDIP